MNWAGPVEDVGRLVDFDGRGGLRAGAVRVKRARIDFHAPRIDHGHALLRCGVKTLALFGEQGQGVQRNQGNLKGLTQALGRRHPNAQAGERTRPTRHRHGVQVGAGPTLLVKHGVDEGHESLGMDVSLLGALLFPGDRRSAFGQATEHWVVEVSIRRILAITSPQLRRLVSRIG